ncbi:MAG: ABC transporter substrate-binding protein [Chloroflexi bacterium]|nr:ABC transporter substrate-binding protein [Chloroflexota bacterium]
MGTFKRTLPVLMMLALFALVFAACAPAAAPAQPTSAPAQPTSAPAQPTSAPAAATAPAAAASSSFVFPSEPITLEFWIHEYAPMTAYLKDLIQQYKAVRPNVTVNLTNLASSDLNTKLNAALATGTGPDIMDADASYYIAYYNKGVLEPVNLGVFGVKDYAELAAKYSDGGLAAGTFDNKVYTLPYQGNSMSLFINNKLFQAAGLDPVKDAPKTWNDLLALCPKLKKVDGNRTVQKAFEFPYSSARWEMQDLQPIIEQFGGKVLSADGKTVSVNSPEAVKALTLWRDVTKACGDPKNTQNTPANPNTDFTNGFEAMWITGPWATAQVTASKVKNDFTVVGLPQVDPANPHTMVYGWAWGVYQNRPADNKTAAWDFIKFMLGKPDQWLAKAGFVQPVKGVADSQTAKDFPFFAVHMKDVQTATWYIRSSYANEIATDVGKAVESVVYDGADPKTSLDAAQAAIDKAMAAQ